MTALGGPVFFVQAPDGLWGKFRTPDGADVVPGRSIDIFKCEFLGLYRQVLPPPRAMKETDHAAYVAGHEALCAAMDRDDSEMTLAENEKGLPTFITLLPLNADGT